MEEGPSTPHDLLDNVSKLAQKRAQIRDRISAAISHSDDETLVSFNPFSDPEKVEQASNEVDIPTIRLHNPLPVDEIPSVPPLKLGQDREASLQQGDVEGISPIPSLKSYSAATSGKRRYIAIGSGVLICLLLLGGLFWLLPRPQKTYIASPSVTTARTPVVQKSVPTPSPTPLPTPTPSPTPTPKPKPPVSLSFEDGSTGGWHSSSQDGTIDSIKNTATNLARGGGHVLMVTYDSDDDHSYPCIGTSNLPGTLKAKQTITASILKQKGSRVRASLYVVDRAGKWYTSGVYTQVASNDTWYSMSFTVPAKFPGAASQVGIILFGDYAVVYIDNFSWH